MSMSLKNSALVVRVTMLMLLAIFITGCSGGSGDTDQVIDTNNGNPTTTAPPTENSPPAPVGTSVYIPRPVIEDYDNDNIPDAFDEYPTERARVANPLGTNPLVIDAVYTEIDGDYLDDAALSGRMLTIKGRGFGRPGGNPVLVFMADFGPEAVVPERIDAETWSARSPHGTTSVFAVIGEFRSNDYRVTLLPDESPALFRNRAPHFIGSTVTLSGLNLSGIDHVTLGGETLDIVANTEDQLQVLLPNAPLGNLLRIKRAAFDANPIRLKLRRTIRLRHDPALILPTGTTLHVYHEGTRFDVDPVHGVILETDAHRPIMLYLHLTDRFGDTDHGALGTLVWPDENEALISTDRALLAEIHEQRGALPISNTGDWRRLRERLSLALSTPEATAFIDGLRNKLLGSTFDANTARQDVLDVLRELLLTIPEPPTSEKQFAQLSGSTVNAKGSASLLGLSPQEIEAEIQQWINLFRQGVGPQVGPFGGYFDDPVGWIVTPFDAIETERGGQSTTADGKEYGGTEFAQFEVAQHNEHELLAPPLNLADRICRYPNNAVPPTGGQLWNSDLCVQNSTPMFASVAVYLPKQRTWGVPYPGSGLKVPNKTDLVRQHSTDILGPNDTSFAKEAIYLEGNLGDWNNKPLCRMQTCFIEVLTGGLGLTLGDWEIDAPVVGEVTVPEIGFVTDNLSDRDIISKLRRRSLYESMILPLIAKMTALPQDSLNKACSASEIGTNPECAATHCVADLVYKDPNFIKAIDQFIFKLGDRKSLSLFILEDFNATIGKYLRELITVDAKNKDFMGCLNALVPEIPLKKTIEDKLKEVGEASGFKIFTAILDASLFTGGVLMTPEKFMYKIGYRAEIAEIFADRDPDDGSIFIDTLNGLFQSGNNPRRLIIEGTWIANDGVINGLGSAYYPELVFRDRTGAVVEFQVQPGHLKPLDHVALRRLEIPLTELKPTLDLLAPGPLEIYVKLSHGGGFPGYVNDFGDNDVLYVPPPYKIELKGPPRIWGFDKAGVTQGDILTAYGSGFEAFDNPTVVLIPNASNPNLNDIPLPKTAFQVSPGGQGEDDELQIRIPDDVLPPGFLFADYGLYVEQVAFPDSLITDSIQEDAIFNIVRTPMPAVSLADYGQHKDDSMTLTLLHENKEPVTAANPNGPGFKTWQWNVPFGEGFDKRYVVTAWFNPENIAQIAQEPYFVEVKCVDPGNDNDCTYGINAAGTLLGDDKHTENFRTSAGKLRKGESKLYCLADKCPLIIF